MTPSPPTTSANVAMSTLVSSEPGTRRWLTSSLIRSSFQPSVASHVPARLHDVFTGCARGTGCWCSHHLELADKAPARVRRMRAAAEAAEIAKRGVKHQGSVWLANVVDA